MFDFLKGTTHKRHQLERSILRKNDISILILDERWNSLFASVTKSEEIMQQEQILLELLKEEARLNLENKELSYEKKIFLDKIISLTPKVYNQNDDTAKQEMATCQEKVNQINERFKKIEEELDAIPLKIKEANLVLLEYTIDSVYLSFRQTQKRREELLNLIEETQKQLNEYTEEREKLGEDDQSVYTYFHDLLGVDKLEELDNIYFNKVIKK